MGTQSKVQGLELPNPAADVRSATELLAAIRPNIAFLFAMGGFDQLLELRDALRELRTLLQVDLEETPSICGTFDMLADMAKAGTFGPAVASIPRVVPPRVRRTKDQIAAAAAAPAQSDATESDDEESDDDSTEETAAE